MLTDDHDLLRVMREEVNSTTNQLLSEEVITYINPVKVIVGIGSSIGGLIYGKD